MKKLFLTLSVLLLAVSGLAAIYVKQQGQSDKIYYVHCDHLGSILSLTDAIGGATSGYAEGFTSGLIMTGDIKEANKAGLNGLYSGAAIGGITGSMSGYKYAKDNGLNLWTGKEVATKTESQSEYTYTKSAGKHMTEVIQHGENIGQLRRPYMKSPLTIQEIMSTGKGIPDATFKGGMNYKVPGSFNGSQGIFELGINPQTNTIYHFLFKTVK